MNTVVRINGVSLIAPANPRLAADLGLIPDPDQASPADAPAQLCPTEVKILTTLQGWRRSASIPDLRDRLGLTQAQGNTLAQYARRLEARGLLVCRILHRSPAPTLALTLTDAGAAWTAPEARDPLAPDALIRAVAAVNDMAVPPRGTFTGLEDTPPGRPASTLAVCRLVLRTDSGTAVDRTRRALHALADAGQLVRVRHPGTGAAYFWARP